MGIDIYLRWEKMSTKEKRKQVEHIFSTDAGSVGYLREAYHGGPYATQIVFREAFESPTAEAEIPAAVMRARMNSVTEPARGCDTGHHVATIMSTLVQAEMAHEQVKEEPTESIIEKLKHKVNKVLENRNIDKAPPATQPMTGKEAIYLRCRTVYPEQGEEYANKVIESFEAFIALAEIQEQKTGKPCTVVASY